MQQYNEEELKQQYSSIIQSLLTRSKEMGEKSCLNWGQRECREKDEAYIRLSTSNFTFFPNKGESFTLETVDGKKFTCIREQDNGKAITTIGDKSTLGIYFRDKLGLTRDAFIETECLNAYGRTDVTFYKVNDNHYIMSFEVYD